MSVASTSKLMLASILAEREIERNVGIQLSAKRSFSGTLQPNFWNTVSALKKEQ